MVEVTELYADELATDDELTEARDIGDTWAVKASFNLMVTMGDLADGAEEWAVCEILEEPRARLWAAMMAHASAFQDISVLALIPLEFGPNGVGILRDIFGNPFRAITINPAWRTGNVVAIAQSIYDERAFDRMPILADALEDAGCTNADVLNHCRQPGEHVRGCWVVDLLLGKS